MLPELPPSFTCPHCLEANPPFGPARCAHCGLTMISDREQYVREHQLPQWWAELRDLQTRQSPSQLVHMREMQRLVAAWTPYEKLSPSWKGLLQPMRHSVAHWEARQARYQQQWRLHVAILVLLLLAPALAWWISGDPLLGFLLVLPAFGWTWLGLIEFRRKHRP